MRRTRLASLCTVALGFAPLAAADPVDDALAGRIGNGTLTESRDALLGLLAQQDDNDRARLALGLVETLLAGEHLVQQMYRHGFGEPTRDAGMTFLPFLGAMPYNSNPAQATDGLIEEVALQVRERLDRAYTTLGQVSNPDVKLRFDVAALRIDLNASGLIEPDEVALDLYRNLVMAGQPPREGDSFELAIDRADVEWLRAYCCVLMAASEMVAAHDWTELFQRTGHLLFPNIDSGGYDFLQSPGPFDITGSGFDISDLIAMVHLVNLPVQQPDLMRQAHGHLLNVTNHSGAMWDFIEQETDDDREWIPSPTQTPAISGVRIDAERMRAWRRMLTQARAVLTGQKLVRFWRGDGSQGLNLRRVFHEPHPFDLVLWVQGSAAKPYLEQGELVEEGFWRDLEDAFGDNWLGYFVYIN